MSDEERFFKYVKKTKRCWEWTGNKNNGYGHFRIGSRTNGSARMIKAHRFSYEMYKGCIPNKLYVLHICDHRPCVNPDHLYLGTYKDNSRDRLKRNRDSWLSGEKAPSAKLTERHVKQIRNEYPSKTQKELAVKYGVARTTITAIINKRNWKHI